MSNHIKTINIITLELQEFEKAFLHNPLSLDMILASQGDICEWSDVAAVHVISETTLTSMPSLKTFVTYMQTEKCFGQSPMSTVCYLGTHQH